MANGRHVGQVPNLRRFGEPKPARKIRQDIPQTESPRVSGEIKRGVTTISMRTLPKIAPAEGKLGVLTPGMGAVTTTFVAGVETVKKGLSLPIGSLTQMGRVRLGKRTDDRNPLIRDFVPLASLPDLVFGGWDIYEDNCYDAATKAGVLSRDQIDQVRAELEAIQPMPAVFDQRFVSRIDGPNIKKGSNKMELAEGVTEDIRKFKESTGASRLVMIWCGSTEVFHEVTAAHQSLQAFEGSAAEERSRHRAQSDLRLCRSEVRGSFRQRRAELDRRLPGHDGAGQGSQRTLVRQGL